MAIEHSEDLGIRLQFQVNKMGVFLLSSSYIDWEVYVPYSDASPAFRMIRSVGLLILHLYYAWSDLASLGTRNPPLLLPYYYYNFKTQIFPNLLFYKCRLISYINSSSMIAAFPEL